MFDISVLIPYYNAEKFLPRLFNSIISQDIEKLQIICINDGSTDNSCKLVNSFSKELKPGWELENLSIIHTGQAAAISEGLYHIDADLFTWIDADDELMDGFFSKRIEFFIRYPDYCILRNNILVDNSKVNKDNELLFDEKLRCETDVFLGMYKSIFPTAGAGVYTIKTKAFFEIYPNKTIPFSVVGQNLQLILPPLSKHKCGYIDETLYRYINRPHSHSNERRSIKEVVDRINAIHQLLLELIPYCDYSAEELRKYANQYQIQERSFYLKQAAQLNRC